MQPVNLQQGVFLFKLLKLKISFFSPLTLVKQINVLSFIAPYESYTGDKTLTDNPLQQALTNNVPRRVATWYR